MGNLISAGLIRLWKSTVFWVALLATVCVSIFSMMVTLDKYDVRSLDVLLVADAPVGIIAAVCIALLIGKDYHNGTIRNKIIVGHNRISVYLSNLIICSIFTVFLYLERLIFLVAVVVPALGELSQSAEENLLIIAASIMCVLAFTAVYVLLAMLTSDMTFGSVTAVLLAFGMLFGCLWVYSRLQEPEHILQYGSVDRLIRNPSYIAPPMRIACLLLEGLLPNGQMQQLSKAVAVHTSRSTLAYWESMPRLDPEQQINVFEMMQLSFAVMLATTTCGVLAFRRKNLK